MGGCASCEATAVGPAATGKLILASGDLQEFDRPIRVSSIIEKNSEWFICDADEMEFDGFISAVGSDDELNPGQIYFVLPRSMLKKPLHAEELAALAVKASAALMNGRPLVFGVGEKKEMLKTVTEMRRRSKRASSGRGRNFVTDLCVIQE
ncbi:uncharacterized protein A4U43_C03F8180 [Asparagus officinalis]|uniref:Uncharacterized protein n=1 Tax=Asparagus officinalis TaxID=4686 RepID=A0A5P1F8V2_ASPOF|nr:uncharacterized protein LOC109833225 [Asparagus officinalis]ONK74602.1 uncharacterized protein A4U43_C03F8180 [Asparagus officinalis]